MVAVVTVFGVLGLAVVVTDIFVTVLKPGADGFLAYRFTNLIWRLARGVHRRRTSHRGLSNAGVALVAMLPLVWLGLMWLLWSLIFLVNERSVLDATTAQPSDGWSKVYFAGYTLFTSGLGDHVPGSSLWQIVTVVTTAMGLGLVTLAVTFLVPVLQAANARRGCARTISQIGDTSADLVANMDLVEVTAPSLAASFASVAEQHTSYPMLDHLHTQNEQNSLPVQLDHLHTALGSTRAVTGGAPAELRLLALALEDLVLVITPELDDGGDDVRRRIERLRWANGWEAPLSR